MLRLAILLLAAAVTLTAQDSSPEAKVKNGDSLLAQRKYLDAFDAYRGAREAEDPSVRVRAGVGAVRSLLKVGQYGDAARMAADVEARDPSSAPAIAAHGDAYWMSGLFFEAEDRYAAALALDQTLPAALHGRGRSLAAQRKMTEAVALVTRAIAADPTEQAYWNTLGFIQEQAWQYTDALESYRRALALMPVGADDDAVKRTRTLVQYLSGFRGRNPRIVKGEDAVHEVPFRVKNGRAIVRASLNGGRKIDFELDTGADATVVTPAVARRSDITSTTWLHVGGVGAMGGGIREVQVARVERFDVGGLRVEHLPALIKSPALRGLPSPETEAFSPIAMGLSVRIDYARGLLTLARVLPPMEYDTRLPLRVQGLALVRATVNGSRPGSFVIDTGGDATALSGRLAAELGVDPGLRRVPVLVWGTAGWDSSAFLLPFVHIELAPSVGIENKSVVVLDLAGTSALLGVDLAGILGHEFLSRYLVSIDLQRQELGLNRR